MLTIIRKSQTLSVESPSEFYNPVTWYVRSNGWRPPTDVYETETGLVVKIDIAGIHDEDFEVAIQGTVLLISGVRSDSSERRAYHQMEIPFGKFSVGIELPASVITEDAKAEYQDGFLVIHIPKDKMDK
jgi:HSP20 family molecular chaperone IbpA